MNYQVQWSELVLPELTKEQKEGYSEIGIAQVYPIGKIVNGRRLFHAIMTLDQMKQAFNIVKEKKPKIVFVRDKDAIDYGYKKQLIQTQDEEAEVTYEIVRDEEIEPFICEDNADYFQSYTVQDDEGNEIEVKPSNHQFGGWK